MPAKKKGLTPAEERRLNREILGLPYVEEEEEEEEFDTEVGQGALVPARARKQTGAMTNYGGRAADIKLQQMQMQHELERQKQQMQFQLYQQQVQLQQQRQQQQQELFQQQQQWKFAQMKKRKQAIRPLNPSNPDNEIYYNWLLANREFDDKVAKRLKKETYSVFFLMFPTLVSLVLGCVVMATTDIDSLRSEFPNIVDSYNDWWATPIDWSSGWGIIPSMLFFLLGLIVRPILFVVKLAFSFVTPLVNFLPVLLNYMYAIFILLFILAGFCLGVFFFLVFKIIDTADIDWTEVLVKLIGDSNISLNPLSWVKWLIMTVIHFVMYIYQFLFGAVASIFKLIFSLVTTGGMI